MKNSSSRMKFPKAHLTIRKPLIKVRKILVGLNKYESIDDDMTDTQHIDKIAVQQQLDRLNKLKITRNMDDVKKVLTNLKKTTAGDGNLLPQIIDAVKAHATLGEISDTLREEFGEY